MAKQTPLIDAHRTAGGKMVDFAGWEMPVHYGSQLAEHHQVRRAAGMFDVSHMGIVDCQGEGATDFLRHVLAGDVARLADDGRAQYGCLLAEDGGIRDDLIVYRFGPNDFRLIVNAGTRDHDLAWLRQQADGSSVQLHERLDLALIAVQGPAARELAHQALGDDLGAGLKRFQGRRDGERMLARTGYTGEDGYEIAIPTPQIAELWQALQTAGVQPCGLGARDTLRLEAGMHLYGQDMDRDTTPLQCGLGWTVHFDDPDRHFIGRDALVRQRRDGIAEELVGLLLQDRGIMRHDFEVVHAGEVIGRVTSGSQSPTLGRSIGLARIRHPGSDQVQVRVRGRDLPAVIVPLPFVRHGRVRVDSALLEENPQ